MSNMPEKNPGVWAAALAWLAAHQTQIYASEAAAVALCRVVYGGGGKRQMVLEAICGMIGSSLIPVLEYLTLPANLATFAGCMVGFVGVEKLRDYSDRFMSR